MPKDSNSEIVFVGRSNSGKSSVLNALTNQKNLAKISKIPGRTQLINFFVVEKGYYIVDLPWLWICKSCRRKKENWKHLLMNYLKKRKQIRIVLLVMDIRHPLSELDVIMLELIKSLKLQSIILLNKSDKLSKSGITSQMNFVYKFLYDKQMNYDVLSFSSTKIGIDNLEFKINNS